MTKNVEHVEPILADAVFLGKETWRTNRGQQLVPKDMKRSQEHSSIPHLKSKASNTTAWGQRLSTLPNNSQYIDIICYYIYMILYCTVYI